MNQTQMIAVFLVVGICLHSVHAVNWPAMPSSNGIRSSVCQTKLKCSKMNIVTIGVCKAFCLGRKRFWQKCGKNGSKSKSKICNAPMAHVVEKAGKGLMAVTNVAVKAVIALAPLLLAGK